MSDHRALIDQARKAQPLHRYTHWGYSVEIPQDEQPTEEDFAFVRPGKLSKLESLVARLAEALEQERHFRGNLEIVVKNLEEKADRVPDLEARIEDWRVEWEQAIERAEAAERERAEWKEQYLNVGDDVRAECVRLGLEVEALSRERDETQHILDAAQRAGAQILDRLHGLEAENRALRGEGGVGGATRKGLPETQGEPGS